MDDGRGERERGGGRGREVKRERVTERAKGLFSHGVREKKMGEGL